MYTAKFSKKCIALIGLKKVFAIADDIFIYGSGTTLKDAEKDHKINLSKVREKCKEQHIKLNNEKSCCLDQGSSNWGSRDWEKNSEMQQQIEVKTFFF